MPRTTLRSDHPTGPHSVDGTLVNAQNRAINGVSQDRGGASSGGRQFRGVFHASDPPDQGIQGVAVITNATDTCDDDPDLEGEKKAPCKSLGLYLAKFRVFDWNGNQFVDFDEEVPLNAGASWETANSNYSNSSGYPHGAIPLFDRGDCVPCYWDENANALVPLTDMPREEIVAEFSGVPPGQTTVGLEGDAGTDKTLIASLEIDDGSGGFRSVSGRDLAIPLSSDNNDARSGMMFTSFHAKHGTKVRMVAGGPTDGPEALLTSWGFRLWAVSRRVTAISNPGGISRPDFQVLGNIIREYTARPTYKDQPTFVLLGSGQVEIQIDDPSEVWDIHGEFRIELEGNNAGSGGPVACVHCAPTTTPEDITITLPATQLANGSCGDCVNLLGAYNLAFVGGGSSFCEWKYDYGTPFCGSIGNMELVFRIEQAGNQWVKRIELRDQGHLTGTSVVRFVWTKPATSIPDCCPSINEQYLNGSSQGDPAVCLLQSGPIVTYFGNNCG